MKSTTPWQSLELPRFPELTGTVHCDVLVVGAGITGLTAAYLLKKAGKRVAVLERNRIGGGDTGCTTAHLTCVIDLALHELSSTFGRETAKLVWEGGTAAVNTIEQIGRTVNAECEFRRVPGFRHLPVGADDDGVEALQEECDLANDLGFAATFLNDVPRIGQPGIRYPNQAKFHPLRYPPCHRWRGLGTL